MGAGDVRRWTRLDSGHVVKTLLVAEVHVCLYKHCTYFFLGDSMRALVDAERCNQPAAAQNGAQGCPKLPIVV